jgi:hypothetical protein
VKSIHKAVRFLFFHVHVVPPPKFLFSWNGLMIWNQFLPVCQILALTQSTNWSTYAGVGYNCIIFKLIAQNWQYQWHIKASYLRGGMQVCIPKLVDLDKVKYIWLKSERRLETTQGREISLIHRLGYQCLLCFQWRLVCRCSQSSVGPAIPTFPSWHVFLCWTHPWWL